MSIDLSAAIDNVSLESPLILASGIFLDTLIERNQREVFASFGACVTKTVYDRIRHPHPEPWTAQILRDSLINSVGLPSKGLDYFLTEQLPWYRRYCSSLVVSISGSSPQGYLSLAQRLSEIPDIVALELNVSCPNLEDRPLSPQEVGEVVAMVRSVARQPVWVKLSPLSSPLETAAQAVQGGAHALIVANTLPSMALDVQTRRSRIGTLYGGLSGPAVKPIILRLVHLCAQTFSLPIIGCGGVTTADDVLEYMLAGASAVQLGTSLLLSSTRPETLLSDLKTWCVDNHIQRLRDLKKT